MRTLQATVALATLIAAGCSSDGVVGLQPDAALQAKSVHMVPFKANQSAEALPTTGVVCPAGSLPTKASPTGTGTHIGKYTGVSIACFAFTGPTTFDFVTGTNNVVAANGDELWFTLDPVARGHGAVVFGPNGPSLTWSAEYDVTGGTGRFAGATGHVTVTGSRDLSTPGAPFLSDILGQVSSVGSS
ncbi:MAG: hypothetical protein ABIZ91_03840 [Gemmatimonadaceae bacterium]